MESHRTASSPPATQNLQNLSQPGQNPLKKLALKIMRLYKRTLLPRKHHFWEYHGRMTLVADYLKQNAQPGDTILDIGGAPGNNLLTKYQPNPVTTLDLNPKADIVASATQIPLEDQSYDFVTCIDTLEHIPQQDRAKTIKEILRVARKGAVIIAPQDTPENKMAEELVLNYINDPFLNEHKNEGLLDPVETENQLATAASTNQIQRYERHEIDNLHSWVLLMTADHADASEVYSRARFLENQFHPRRVGFLIWKPHVATKPH